MKVALVWLGPLSRDTGGRTYLQELIAPLADALDGGLALHLADRDFKIDPGLEVYHYPLIPGPAGRLALEAFVMRRIRAQLSDVLLAPLNYLPATWAGPSVVVQHNLLAGEGVTTHTGQLGLLRSSYRRRAVASSVRRATRVIAVSEHLRRCLLEWYPDVDASRIRVVPLAPATELIAASEAIATPGPTDTVLVVGALWGYKGVEDAVDAFSSVAQHHPRLRLQLAGPGSTRERRAILERAGRRGVRDRVDLLGHLTHAELAQRYRAARTLLFLSRIESFGLPVVEAMALGVPVVARRIPGMLEVAGDSPFWVDDDASPTAIARVLEQALTNQPARLEAISRGLSRTSQLTWSATAELTADVILEAVREPQARAAADDGGIRDGSH